MKNQYFISIFVALISLSCKDGSTDSTKSIQFQNVENASYFRLDKDTVIIITDSAEWNSLYDNYWSDSSKSIPQINFQIDQVVAFFLPAQSGCTAKLDLVTKIEVNNSSVKIYRKAYSSGMLGYCTGWFYPFQIIQFQRQELPVEFVIQ